jgi:YVTN family beta-propeller protein
MVKAVKIPFLFFILFLLLFSCSYSFFISITPEDADVIVDGQRFENNSRYSTKKNTIEVDAKKEGYLTFHDSFKHNNIPLLEEVFITLEKKTYEVAIDAIGEQIEFTIDGEIYGVLPFKGFLSHDIHKLVLTREGGPIQPIMLDVKQEGEFLFRYQEPLPFIDQMSIYSCGGAPKQVTFSPDDRYLFITLLGGTGFQIFDMEKKKILQLIGPKKWAKRLGFVEGIFIEKYGSYFVSQMGPAQIYEYKVDPDGTVVFKRSIKTGGSWSKVIAYCPQLDLLAVSNWSSDNVSIIDYNTGKVLNKIGKMEAPRGVAFSRNGKYLYVTSFDGGLILKYRTKDWKEIHRIYKRSAAMRHVVVTNDDKRIFVSNMYHCEVYEIDCESFTILHTYKVFHNPNTIDITDDARFLFVSCRGPNNKKAYTLRSPQDGQVIIFNTETKERVAAIKGGNQPTGLDVSNNGKYLAFSNFKDANFELYDISALQRIPADCESEKDLPIHIGIGKE